jgi:hypothetical protein
MPGHSKDESSLANVLWPDAELGSASVDYDAVTIKVRESTGRQRSIRCEGHIGYELCGFWDEVIVERAELTEEDEIIVRCTRELSRRLGTDWPETGNATRNDRTWKALVIHLSDGAALKIVAARFFVE